VKPYFFPEGTGTGQYLMLASDLLEAPVVHTGEWQSMKTEGSPAHATHELEDVSVVWDRIPQTPGGLYNMVPMIDGQWASEHFEERVSGLPLNPAPSHTRWPYAVRGNADHTDAATRFDHTYPERFWPKHAGHDHDALGERWREAVDNFCGGTPGVRFHYGDLNDVVDLLIRNPLTRQAYLPVWFPEDTGAVDGQRVPCTLGYHFMQRGGRLSVRYYLRSCDLYRHFSNDVFFCAALVHWICNKVSEKTVNRDQFIHFRPGGMVMHISSLHAFVGDEKKLKDRINLISSMHENVVEGYPV